MTARGNLSLRLKALDTTPAAMRRALGSFMEALGVPEDLRIDIITAAGEALANAVEHAYDSKAAGAVELTATLNRAERTLAVDVIDQGSFVERAARPQRGFGLRIIRSVAKSVVVDTAAGTAVRMVFDLGASSAA